MRNLHNVSCGEKEIYQNVLPWVQSGRAQLNDHELQSRLKHEESVHNCAKQRMLDDFLPCPICCILENFDLNILNEMPKIVVKCSPSPSSALLLIHGAT